MNIQMYQIHFKSIDNIINRICYYFFWLTFIKLYNININNKYIYLKFINTIIFPKHAGQKYYYIKYTTFLCGALMPVGYFDKYKEIKN